MRQRPKPQNPPVGVGVPGKLADVVAAAADSDSLRALAAHLQQAREDERAALAQTLHDVLGQAVSLLKLDLSALRKEIDGGTSAAGLLETVSRMDATIDSMLDAVPRLIRELRPVLLDTLGFQPAARALLGEVRRTGLRVTFRGDDSIRLTAAVSTVLYRALQEAVLNVQRHANASSIAVTVQRDRSEIILQIADDGQGLDKDFERKPGTFGLQSVKERLRELHGTLTVESMPSGGTRFVARIPDDARR